MLLPSDEKISILRRKTPTQKVKVAYVLSGIAAVLIGLIIHVFVKGPQFEKLEDQAYFELKCSQFDKAHADFQELIQNDPTIVRHHYYYIQTFYFLSTAKQNTRYFDKIEADTLASFYEKIAQDSSNNKLKDIGNFGKGMLAYMENKNDEALHTLAAISNQNIAFLSFLRAKIYFNNHNLPEAIHFCRREILLHDNIHAYEMYLEILNDSKKISELDKFIHAYETSTKIPEEYKRKHYLRNKELVKYIWSIGKLFTEICST